MRSDNRKGLTLVEILVAMVIMAVVVSSAYVAFLSIAKLTEYSRSELEAYMNASAWIERLKAEIYYEALYGPANTWVDLYHDNSSVQDEYSANWPMAENPNITDLEASYKVEEDVTLGSGQTYKRVTVKVQWKEIETGE